MSGVHNAEASQKAAWLHALTLAKSDRAAEFGVFV
jgi:hypothetical protein